MPFTKLPVQPRNFQGCHQDHALQRLRMPTQGSLMGS